MLEKNHSLTARAAARIEHLLMTRLVPKDNTGILFKWFFKIPIAQVNPSSLAIWKRWAGDDVDGSMESMKRAAKFFPCFRLKKI